MYTCREDHPQPACKQGVKCTGFSIRAASVPFHMTFQWSRYKHVFNRATTIRTTPGVSSHQYEGTRDGDGVLLVVYFHFGSSFLLAILTMTRKAKETSVVRKEFQLVLWSWISMPVSYQI